MRSQRRRSVVRSAVAVPVAAAIAIIPLATSSAGASATSSPAHCTYGQLSVREGPSDGAAGTISIPLHFRNTSAHDCTVFGYPGAAGLNKHGKQVVQARRTRRGIAGGLAPGHHPTVITLHPGQQATAIIEGSDVQHGDHPCRTLHGLLVTPPNDQKSVAFHRVPPDCGGLQIHPVIKGKTGRQS